MLRVLAAVAAMILWQAQAWAKSPTEAEFLAASIVADDLAHWVANLPTRPTSLGVFYVRTNAPLDSEFAGALESILVQALQANANLQVSVCAECRTPQVEVREDRLIVRRGAPDQKAFLQFGKLLGVDSFLTVDVYRTPISLMMNATIYQASSGQIVGSEQFRAPAVEWSDSAMQVLIAAGPAFVTGGKTVDSNTRDFSFSGSLSLLEEIGQGTKGGLTLGGVGAGGQGALLYATPVLGWRGRFGKSGVQTLKSGGLGFGYSNDAGGVAGRLGYDIFVGSFTNIGADVVGLFPVNAPSGARPVNAAFGIHLGFSVGR